jgi:hypothetical protein
MANRILGNSYVIFLVVNIRLFEVLKKCIYYFKTLNSFERMGLVFCPVKFYMETLKFDKDKEVVL